MSSIIKGTVRRELKLYTNRRLMSKLADLKKTSSFTDYMTVDASIPTVEFALENEELLHKPRILKSGGFSYTLPEKRAVYQYLTHSENALDTLGLAKTEATNPDFIKLVSGETTLDTPFPYSQAYAGWQFGQFAGQLGDGRVVNLFEVRNPTTGIRYELQLKGAGKTPYSRFADGKAVLRSSIREFVISEALNAIGIPTSRALAITYFPKTLAQRHRVEKCAVVLRFAESWVRLGSFDLYRWRGDRDGIRKLSDYVITEVFKDKLSNFEEVSKNNSGSLGNLTQYDKMYLEIVKRNAETTAMWQVYGFLNGVLNTDNTSVLGLSIDFGPFAIMDKYDPDYTSNNEDHEKRYGYRNTPTAIWWNLTRLGEDLAELIGAGESLLKDDFFVKEGVKSEWETDIIRRATKVIEVAGEMYQNIFTAKYLETMGRRLGLRPTVVIDRMQLIEPMLDFLRKSGLDYNKFFVALQTAKLDDNVFNFDSLVEHLFPTSKFTSSTMYEKEEVLKELREWMTVYKEYLDTNKITDKERYEIASKANPLFLPRGWILDEVISFTEENDGAVGYLNKVMKMGSNPYDTSKWGDELKDVESKWLSEVDEDLSMLQCSCSS